MINKSKDSTTTVKVVCAILFIAFIISYIYFFQSDLLAMIQHAWSKGQTHYDSTIGLTVLLISFLLLSLLTSVMTSLPQRMHSFIFFPAMLCMGLLTAVEVNGCYVTTSMPWLIASPIILLAFFVFARIARQYTAFLVPLRSTSFLSQPWWTNIMVFVFMALLTYSMGNTDRTLHTRLAVERMCKQKQWDEALAYGFPQYDNDSSLTMLRAMALAQSGLNLRQDTVVKTKKDTVVVEKGPYSNMGEHLFEYQITGGSKSLLVQPDKSVCFLLCHGYRLWQTLGFVPRDKSEAVDKILKREIRRGTAKPAVRDYLLCAYLLDCDLKSFTECLKRYYIIDKSLPKHYAEAYVLYCMKYNIKPSDKVGDTTNGEVEGKSVEAYPDDAMIADYADFLALMRSQKNHVLRNAALRDSYFGTYWYYYYSRNL